MKRITSWVVLPLLMFCCTYQTHAQDANSEKALHERVSILELELVKLRSELSTLRKILYTPRIVLRGVEEKELNGRKLDHYTFSVENYANFPDEMFRPAPDLPPCGMNVNAARTWLDVMSGDGRRVSGYCALSSPQALEKITFSWRKDLPLPKGFYIVMKDRETGIDYKSNLVSFEVARAP